VTRYSHASALAWSSARSQDATQVFERDDVLVAVLADGGGSLRGGEAASRTLLAIVESAVNDRSFVLHDTRRWVELFHETDRALAAHGPKQTTGIVVVLGPRGLVGVSTGDSEAWLVTPTSSDNLTVGQQTKQRLGGNQVSAATFERPALTGTLLVASDGLFKYASAGVIANVVRASPIENAAKQLVELVRLRSGKVADDVSVLLVRRNDEPIAPS
jgi:serine/threonine protein phosphatase PrpC